MSRAFPYTDEPRLGWRMKLSLASAVAVCALLFVLVRLAPVSQPPSGPEPSASAPPALTSDDLQGDGRDAGSSFNAWLADTTPQGQSGLARPLPREPFKGQKRPPCTRYTEVELVGACWAPHKLKAPCPEELFEYKGECYIPAFSAKTLPPQSVGQ